MSASPPYVAPSQFDAPQFHSEFGYFAPTMRFRRKLALTLKGGALGALVGAVAVFVVVMDREEKAFTMLSTPVLTIPASSAPVLSTQAPSMPVTAAPASPALVVAMPMSSKPGAPAQETSRRVAAAPASSAQVPLAQVASGPASLTPAQAAAINSARVRFVPEALALPTAVPADPDVRGPAPPAVAVGPLDLVPGAIAGAPVNAAPKPKKRIVREPQPDQIVRPAPVEAGSRSAFAAEPTVPRFFRSIFGFGRQ
jgi:hypothetical protein